MHHVLVNRGELVGQQIVQRVDDGFLALHPSTSM
jgi:hypothetical protein